MKSINNTIQYYSKNNNPASSKSTSTSTSKSTSTTSSLQGNNDPIKKSLYETSFQALSPPPQNNSNNNNKSLTSINSSHYNNVNNNNNNNDISEEYVNVTLPSRQEALDQANAVISSTSYKQRQFENFNLLGVVTTPRSLSQSLHGTSSSSSSSSAIAHTTGIDANTLESLGLDSYVDPNLLSNLSLMSSSISKEIESLNSTLYSYSRNYLGNYPKLSNTYNSLVNNGVGIVSGTSNIHEKGYLDNGGSGSGSGSTVSTRSTSSFMTSSTNNTTTTSSSLDYEHELLASIMSDEYNTHIRNVDELPQELVHLDLSTVEKYLRKCGILAQRLDRELRFGNTLKKSFGSNGGAGGAIYENENDGIDNDPISNIPEIFFSPYFDLTDPKTFESLLVLNDDDHDHGEGEKDGDVSHEDTNGKHNKLSKTNNNNNNNNNNEDPIIRIPKPEQLTQYLDTIELGLLNQVRSKSDSFFRETNRFSYLKSLVADLVVDVQTLRSQLDTIREKSITEVELIPVMDRRRKDIKVLGEVLDEIMDVVEVKGSVAGLIAEGDFLGAIEAIHMARSLLNGSTHDDGDDGAEDTIPKDNENSKSVGNTSEKINGDNNGQGNNDKDGRKRKRYALGKVVALNKVNDQLAQYENLVVSIMNVACLDCILICNIICNMYHQNSLIIVVAVVVIKNM